MQSSSLFSSIHDSFAFFSKLLFANGRTPLYHKHLTSSKLNVSTFLLVSDAKHILHDTTHQSPTLHANTSLPKGHFNEGLCSGISYSTLIFMVSICKNLCCNLLFLLRGSLKMARNSQFLFILSSPVFSEYFLFGLPLFHQGWQGKLVLLLSKC